MRFEITSRASFDRIPTCLFPLILVACAVTGPASPANAQPTTSTPGFDPRQTEQKFDSLRNEPRKKLSPTLQMPRLGNAKISGDSKPLFLLRHVSVHGARAISPDAIAKAYQAYLGKKVSQSDLAKIAGAISDLYRNAGFHLSRAIIPIQDIHGGRVTIDVIEGQITEVALKGDNAEQFGVRRFLEAIRFERPSRLATLERHLLLINDQPGVRIVDSSLEEIGAATGNFRLVLHLKTWRVYTSFGLDNLGSSAVGPWQSYSTAAFNSYFLPGDTLAANLSTIPTDPQELAFGRLSYDTPIGSEGTRIGGTALYSEVRPGDYRRQYDTITRTEAFEVKSSFIPLQSQKTALTLTVAAGLSNVSERDSLGAVYNDNIRTVSAASDYKLQDSLGGTNYLSLVVRHGLDVFGASHEGDDLLSRNGASSNFSLADFWFTRYQTLNDSWSLKIAAAGQVASTELFTSQQFYLGGAAFGRGYGSAEISGDNGIAGSLELRFDHKLSYQYLTGYQFYGFVDTGAVWNVGFNYTDGISLLSAGAGVRFFLGGDLQADIGIAAPLSYRAPDNQTRGPRILFSLSNSIKFCPDRLHGQCS